MQLRLICALATAAALAPPAPRLAKQPKRLKTRRILTEDVVVYAGDDELEGDALPTFSDEEDEEAVTYDTQMEFDYTEDMLEME